MRLISEIKIPSRTPINTTLLLDTFKVIHEYEQKRITAIDDHGYLICDTPSIWVIRKDFKFKYVWEVRRGLIILNVQYIEEIEWIVNTLKQSYRKRYEAELKRGLSLAIRELLDDGRTKRLNNEEW